MLRILDARTGEPVSAAPARRGLTRIEAHASGLDPTALRVLLTADLLVRALELGGTPVWTILTAPRDRPELRTAATRLAIRPFEDDRDLASGLGEAQVIHVAQRGTEDALGEGPVVSVAPAEWVPGAETARGTGEAAGTPGGETAGRPGAVAGGEAAGRAGGASVGGADGRAGEVSGADLKGAPGRGVGGEPKAAPGRGVGGERKVTPGSGVDGPPTGAADAGGESEAGGAPDVGGDSEARGAPDAGWEPEERGDAGVRGEPEARRGVGGPGRSVPGEGPDAAADPALPAAFPALLADPAVLRLALLAVPRSEPARLDPAVLDDAARSLARWRRAVAGWARRPSRPVPGEVRERLRAAWEDDLDLPAVLGVLRDVEDAPGVPDGARFETYVYADRLLALDLARDLGSDPGSPA